MKKFLSVFTIMLLVFTTFIPVFAVDHNYDDIDEVEIMAIKCPNCTKGNFLRYDSVIRQKKTETEECSYEGCKIVNVYQGYEDFYRCTYCGYIDSAIRWELISSDHSIKH